MSLGVSMQKFQDAIASDPEVDLVAKLPTEYSTRLKSMRNNFKIDNNNNTIAPPRPTDEDIRASLDASASVETIYPLSRV
ncbi:hypothetical protein BJX65DRAFT_315281 [Aspergillus insuetus]